MPDEAQRVVAQLLSEETPKEFLLRQPPPEKHSSAQVSKRQAERKIAEAKPLIDRGWDDEVGDNIVECPECHHVGVLVADWSYLVAGMNGIEDTSYENCGLQECGQCGAWSSADNLPGPPGGEEVYADD